MSDTTAPSVPAGPASSSGVPRPFEPGTLVAGRFRIVREIAEGGMGVVYEVLDEKLNETRALKCAKPGFAGRLPPEARLSLRVTHPNVCRVFEIHTTDTPFGAVDFLTMEYVDGGTLAASLRRQGAPSEAEARDIALQICAGVQAAHAQQLLHRDLKPSNILLTKDASGRTRAVVTDFGLAQEHALSATDTGWNGAEGTPSYLAPERWRGKPATAASDVFAIGVVLHELITGREPATTGLREKILSPDLPKRWKTVIARCLDPDPARRYPSAAAVATALVDRAGTIRRSVTWAAAVLVPIVYIVWQVMFPAPVAARLAILPLEAAAGDPRTVALVQGAAADLSDRLARWRPRPPRLVVIPVEETTGLDGREPGDARDRLGASHLLRGTVRRRDDQIIVRASIVDTTTKVAVQNWDAQYPASDPGALANGLAGLVAATFKLPRQRDAEGVSQAAYAAYAEGSAALRRGPSFAPAAIDAFERAVALDSRSVLPRAALAEAYFLAWVRSGDESWLARGQTALEEAQKLNPDSLAVRLAAGRLNLVPGKYDRAAREYLRATEVDPGSPEAWLGLARSYQEMPGRGADAVAAFMKTIELQPGYFAPLVGLGDFYRRNGDPVEAEKFWVRAVALAPQLRAVHANLGGLYVETGRWVDAERELLLALTIEPDSRGALNNLGALYQFLGRDREAAKAFERAGTVAPPTPTLLLNLGDSYRRLGMTAAAAAMYRRGRALSEAVLLREPADALELARAAYFDARLGDARLARREVRQALSAGADDFAVHRRAVLCYEALGDRDAAMDVLDSATPEGLGDLARHPDLRGLREDPRFVSIIRRVDTLKR